MSLQPILRIPLHLKRRIDFENSVFGNHPDLKLLKAGLYNAGALYASMSGSGSSIYGIFSTPPDLPGNIDRYVVWKGYSGNPARAI